MAVREREEMQLLLTEVCDAQQAGRLGRRDVWLLLTRRFMMSGVASLSP